MSRWATITFSFALAVSSCLFLFIAPILAILLTTGWAGMIGYSFVKFGRRGWPTMLGAPLAVYPLLIVAWLYYACRVGHDCV
jgi:hypothetical protein